MNRSSVKKTYTKGKDSFIVSVPVAFRRHIRRVLRNDGTEAIGVLTGKGVAILTYKYSIDPFFAKWDIYSLPNGQVYLMENKGEINEKN